MTDPSFYNSPKRLFELYRELTGEDLLNTKKQGKKEVKQK
jgi:hypothetical protein